MRLMFPAIGLIWVLGASAWAGTWCDNFDGIVLPEAIFCDDFDSYCPPPNNNPCPKTPPYDNYFRNAWPTTSWNYHNSKDEVCGNNLIDTNDQTQLTTEYHGGRIVDGGDEAGVLGQQTRLMTAGIIAKYGFPYNQILGTDESPLVLRFDMSSGIHSAAGIHLSDGYVELAMEEHTLTKLEYLDLGYDPEVTPADYIKVGTEEIEGCNSCFGQCQSLGATDGRAPHHMWPTVCQSYDARTESSLCPNPAGGDPIPCGPPYCPETPVDKLHKTMAVGAFAMLDPNPCHCENPVKPDISHCYDYLCGLPDPGVCPAGSPQAGQACTTDADCNQNLYTCGVNGFCAGTATPCTTNDDCHKEMAEYYNHTMTNHHLAFFDGWKWRSLSSAIFDDGQGNGIPGVIGEGDFVLGQKIDTVTLTIKTSTVKIEHYGGRHWYPADLVHHDTLCKPDYLDHEVREIIVTNPGSGYSDASPPTVTISPPPPSDRFRVFTATAEATVSGGQVVAITITDPGMGYKTNDFPTLTIGDGNPPAGGTLATAAVTALGGGAHYGDNVYSWADNIPRMYFGAFNAIRLGNPSSCRLCSSDLVDAGGDYANCAAGQWNGTDYECTEFNQLWHSGATWCKRMSGISGCYGNNIDDGSNFVNIDSLVVLGGTPDITLGACCMPNTTCATTSEADCDQAGGHWAGGGTTCEFTECLCPIPFADADMDSDVDQADFGLWQACFDFGTGLIAGCECFDRVAPADSVDGADLLEFSNCFTGANVPWSQGLTPNCTP